MLTALQQEHAKMMNDQKETKDLVQISALRTIHLRVLTVMTHVVQLRNYWGAFSMH